MALGEIFGGVLGLFSGDVLGNILSEDARTSAASAAISAIDKMKESIAGTAAAKNSVYRALGATGHRASLGYGLVRDQLKSMWAGAETFGRGMGIRRLLGSEELDDAVRKAIQDATGWTKDNPLSVVDLGVRYADVINKLTEEGATDKMRAVANALASSSRNYTTRRESKGDTTIRLDLVINQRAERRIKIGYLQYSAVFESDDNRHKCPPP